MVAVWWFLFLPAWKLPTWCKSSRWWWTVLPATLSIIGGRCYRKSRLINNRCWCVRVGVVQTIVRSGSAIDWQEFFWSLAVKCVVVREIWTLMASLLVVIMHFTFISGASSSRVVLQIRWKIISLLTVQCRIGRVVAIIIEVVQAINKLQWQIR